MSNTLSISTMRDQPFIQVTGTGLWAPGQVEQHFRELDRALRMMRARKGVARVLVDLSKAMVQTSEAAEVMNRCTARVYHPSDRVAVICTTALLAMQIKRQAKVYARATFPDSRSAMNWLLEADEGNLAARA